MQTAPDLPHHTSAAGEQHATETLLASVLASSLDGIMAFRAVRDEHNQIIDFEWLLANPRAEAIVGRRAADLVGRRLLEEMPGNREAGLFDVYVRVVETGAPAEHVFYYSAEGLRAWFQNTAVPLGDGFAVTFRDITQQREAEEIRLAIGRAQMAIFDLDLAEGRFSRSESFDRIFGFPADGRQRTLDDVWAHTHPDDRPAVQQSHHDLITNQREEYIEHRVVRPDGVVRWVSVRGKPRANSAGVATQVHGVLLDITDRKQAEAAHARAETLFRRALAEAPMPILLHTDDGTIVDISAAVTELTGYTLADIPALAEWTERVSGATRQLARDAIEQIYALDQRVDSGEYYVRTSGGALRTWDFSSVPLDVDEHGRRLLLSMAADVTERNQSAAAERQAREAAEAALRMRDQFLNAASHELRTPLTALLGHTQLLARRLGRAGPLSESTARTLSLITQQSQRLSRLISAMLDVAQLQSGSLTLALGRCDLRELAAAALEDIRPLVAARALSIELPPEPLFVTGDAQRLDQVVYSLIANAAAYSRADAPIRLTLGREDGHALLTVADQGSGLPAETLPQTVSSHYSAPETSAAHTLAAMGVGLYLAREIVGQHGGEVRVDGAAGAGSVFVVRLPLMTPAAPSATERAVVAEKEQL